jgi:hypothetical protein
MDRIPTLDSKLFAFEQADIQESDVAHNLSFRGCGHTRKSQAGSLGQHPIHEVSHTENMTMAATAVHRCENSWFAEEVEVDTIK